LGLEYGNYRRVIEKDFKTSKFKRLFKYYYKKNKKINFTDEKKYGHVFVDKYPISIDGMSIVTNINNDRVKLSIYNDHPKYFIKEITKMKIVKSELREEIPRVYLLVRSELVFNK